MNGQGNQKVMEWRLLNDTKGLFSTGDNTDKPCSTILVGGGTSLVLEIYGSR